MLWLWLAIGAHIANAFVFVIDKSLLNGPTKINDPRYYTFLSGVLAGATGLILPFVYTPLTSVVLYWSLVAGAFHLLALWLFFLSLKRGEASRVVPIAGSAVPLFTLIIATLTLSQRLQLYQLGGIGLLLAGGLLLSVRVTTTAGLSSRVLHTTILSGLFFAAHFTTMKYLYDHAQPFLSVFAYSRLVEAILALIILGPLVYQKKYRPARRLARRQRQQNFWATTAFIGAKLLAAGAFILQSYAIAAGDVTIVNALQGVQYLVLLLLAVFMARLMPQFFTEEVHRVALWQKISGTVCVTAGLLFLW